MNDYKVDFNLLYLRITTLLRLFEQVSSCQIYCAGIKIKSIIASLCSLLMLRRMSNIISVTHAFI